ncbi:hypothetical protein MLD38_008244 [Melastoma candidum]|uniref:Uncharacterized protein n=1 Tax=Melastoma candidum TaxID=119954 RepID=A0ACB9RTC2_9MYRT|nr:hypothetical protein MLD38_008244 [Melastoma candidum]
MPSALHCHHVHFIGSRPRSPSKAPRRGVFWKLAGSSSIRCYQSSDEEKTRRVTLRNNGDSLEICRVLNGMWQTSGSWGRIDRDDAVEAMLRHADAGLSTFDMADHCA